MRLFWRLLLVLLAVVLVDFAVTNRQRVELGLWPLPDVAEVPLYLVVLGGLLGGFLAGEVAAWIAARHWRQEARQARRRIAALESELAAAEAGTKTTAGTTIPGDEPSHPATTRL